MGAITMGGLTGGGARLLGPVVAQELGADYVDWLILTDAARHIGATVEALHQREERPPTRTERFASFVQRVLERSAVTGTGSDPYFGPGAMAVLTQEYDALPQATITRGHELEEESYLEALQRVMKDLVAAGNVVIVGRSGSIILRDDPSVLRVGTIARVEDRVERIMERERIDRDQAEKVVASRDKARQRNFRRLFDVADPDDPELYHMVINTSDVDMDFAAEMVVQAYRALDDRRLLRKVSVGT